MAQSFKVLSQKVLDSTTLGSWQLLYSVPENLYTSIQSIIFCNLNDGAVSQFDFGITDSASVPPMSGQPEQTIINNYILDAYQSVDFGPLLLQFGKHIFARVKQGSSLYGYVSVNIFGSENT